MPYVVAQQALDKKFPDGRRYYWKSLNLMRLDDDADAGAFFGREAAFLLNVTNDRRRRGRR